MGCDEYNYCNDFDFQQELISQAKPITKNIKKIFTKKNVILRSGWLDLCKLIAWIAKKNNKKIDIRILSAYILHLIEDIPLAQIEVCHENLSTNHYCSATKLGIYIGHQGHTLKRDGSIDCNCEANFLADSTAKVMPLCCLERLLSECSTILSNGEYQRIIIAGDGSPNILNLGREKASASNNIYVIQEFNKLQLAPYCPEKYSLDEYASNIADSIMVKSGYQLTNSHSQVEFHPCENFLAILSQPSHLRAKYLSIH